MLYLVINFTVIRIGFSEDTYQVAESTTSVTVMLLKEKNTQSEQTFSFEVTVQMWPFLSTLIIPALQLTRNTGNATQESDFALPDRQPTLKLQFLPSIQELSFDVIIFDDNIAEGKEGIILRMKTEDGSPRKHRSISTSPDSRIIIDDEDSKCYIVALLKGHD
jgi:hypothetical protein